MLAYIAGETWRSKVFTEGKDIYCASASQMFGVPVEKHGINGHLRQKCKIAELALGYGGSVGALKSMGALEIGLTEEELQPLVNSWQNSNPMITAFWWDIDRAVKTIITHRILRTEVCGEHRSGRQPRYSLLCHEHDRHCFIVGHVHDELIIECSTDVDLKAVCEQMGRSPDWIPDILLRADGYETSFYKKD